MLQNFNYFCRNVIVGVYASVCCTYPSVFVMNTIHLMNLLIRLCLMVIGVSIAEMFTHEWNPKFPGIAIPEYDFSQWNTLRSSDWTDEELPQMQTVLVAGNPCVVIIYSIVVVTLFVNDLFRCGSIARDEWNPCDNQLDSSWYFMLGISIPMLFAFTALVLGTHDPFTLFVIIVLTFISACAAVCKDFLRVMMNTEKTTHMSGTVMFLIQTIHDLTLFLATVLILIPITYNILHASGGISVVEFAIAIVFGVLYITMISTQYAYEYRCIIIENRWPSEKAVIMWNLPRQTKLPEVVTDTAAVLFPRFPVAYTKDSKNRQVEEESSNIDPFNAETSEQIFDRIYYGCYIESAAEHMKQLVLTPVGSFRNYTNNVEGLTRKSVGLRVEWSRYYGVNMMINTLLVLGIFNLSGFIPV